MITAGISNEFLARRQSLPSCRNLAMQLGVSRNTVFAAYNRLIEMGILTVKYKSGYFVSSSAFAASKPKEQDPTRKPLNFDLASRLSPCLPKPTSLHRIDHPENWRQYPYPFIYNQIDPDSFPLDQWRECIRLAQNRQKLDFWTSESVLYDSPDLMQQLRQRLLNYRGINVSQDQLLITLGVQNALFIVATLFSGAQRRVGMENPGYIEGRNAFLSANAEVVNIPVDEHGLKVEAIPERLELVYTTPSHQFPTTVTMPTQRRIQLLNASHEQDFLIIEDDYEAETNYVKDRRPTLKSLDRFDRVIYVGSLSKSLSPGMRLGFMVAHPDIIQEARSLRRFILRHPPTLIQDAVAMFFKLGYHDERLRNIYRNYRLRWREMKAAIDTWLSKLEYQANKGGTCFWIKGARELNTRKLSETLNSRGVLIDEGSQFFYKGGNKGLNYFRLCFVPVPIKSIQPGIKIIAEEINKMS